MTSGETPVQVGRRRRRAAAVSPSTHGSLRLGPADLALLKWLVDWRYATVAQAARLADRNHEALRRRIRRLEFEAGLVRTSRPLAGIPTVVMATARGSSAVGIPTESPRLSHATLLHTLLVADVAISYTLLGHEAVSERRIAARDMRTDGPLTWAGFRRRTHRWPHLPDAVVLPPVDGDPGRHRPDDDLMEHKGRTLRWRDRFPFPAEARLPLAVEVELAAKRPVEYRELCVGYRGAEHLSGVLYLTPEPSIAQAVSRAAEATGLAQSGRFLVRPLVAFPGVIRRDEH